VPVFSPITGRRESVADSGPTYEAIDAVRGITNRSSGKMGYAIAQAALELGAEVTLVSGPTALEPPQGAHLLRVESALEMFEAVKKSLLAANFYRCRSGSRLPGSADQCAEN